MRPFGSPQQLEKRRRRAMELLDQGLSLTSVGRRLGCAASSVMRWRDSRARHGDAGLTARPASGRPPKLTPAQKRKLLRLLLKGAMANGFRTQLWTTARIAEVIERAFAVRYHPDHVGRLMRAMGWSCQKPERRALERDERAIADWKRREWPRIKKTPGGWAPTSSSSTSRASC